MYGSHEMTSAELPVAAGSASPGSYLQAPTLMRVRHKSKRISNLPRKGGRWLTVRRLLGDTCSTMQKLQLITDVDQIKITPCTASSGIRSEITWPARTAR